MQTFNVQQTYIGKNEPWTDILAAAALVILLTNCRQICYSPLPLIFGHDMITLTKHRLDWELIRQQKHTQINRDNTNDNKIRIEYNYKVRDKLILTDHSSCKYETPYKGTFMITKCFTNGTVMLQYD